MPPSPPPQDFPRDLSEAYEPLRVLGAGAMGTIFLARDRALERLVAVKLLQEACDRDMRARFTRAAASLARVKHPNLIQVLDQGTCEAGPFLVLEYLQGASLEEAGALEDAPDSALEVMLEVAGALEELHDHGLVHRDVKPANIVRTHDGRTVLLDLDLVYDPGRTRTAEGVVIGTLSYLAPELLRGARPDPRVDWFAWGVTLFRLLEGRRPYDPERVLEVLEGEPLPEPEFRTLPAGSPARALLARCLSPDPAGRPRNLAHIRRLLDGSEVHELPPPAPLAPAAAVLPPSRSLDSTQALARVSGSLRLVGSRARWLLPASALVLAGALLWRGMAPSPPAASTPPAETPTPPATREPPGHGLGPAWVEDVIDELRLAGETYLTKDGRRLRLEAVEDLRAVRELLDPDPLRWPEVVRELPEVSRFHAWIRQGGDPTRLAPEIREGLRRADEGYLGYGMRPPFSPFRAAAPAPSPVPVPVSPPFGVNASSPLAGRSLAGWSGAAVAAVSEAVRFRRSLEAQLEAARPPEELEPPMPAPLHRFPRTFPSLGLEDLLQMVFGSRDLRVEFGRWLGPMLRATEAGLFAYGRALREEEEDARQLSVFFSQATHSLWVGWGAGVYQDPLLLLGGEPPDPAGWLVAARALQNLHLLPGRKFLADPAARERVRRAFFRSLEGPYRDRADRHRRVEALLRTLEMLRQWGTGEEITATFERHREVLDRASADLAGHLWVALARCAVRREDPPALPQDTTRRMLAWFRRMRPHHLSQATLDPLARLGESLEAAVAPSAPSR